MSLGIVLKAPFGCFRVFALITTLSWSKNESNFGVFQETAVTLAQIRGHHNGRLSFGLVTEGRRLYIRHPENCLNQNNSAHSPSHPRATPFLGLLFYCSAALAILLSFIPVANAFPSACLHSKQIERTGSSLLHTDDKVCNELSLGYY